MPRFLFVPLLFLAAGCGREPQLVPVSGRVTLNGTPLEGAAVYFQPSNGAGLMPFGRTDADGRYTLRVEEIRGVGAAVGNYRVVITKVGKDEYTKDGWKPPKNEIPARFNADSQLTCDVPAAGREDADFDLTAP
jgi:hypothetical protein